MSYIFLVLEIICITLAVILQIVSFARSRKRMHTFLGQAKDVFSGLSLKTVFYRPSDLDNPDSFQSVIGCRSTAEIGEDEPEDSTDVESIVLVDSPVLGGDGTDGMSSVIRSTNAYLVKNKGIASDFGILQNICERRLEGEDALISDSLSTPLYLGLCGTFVGIVCGVAGMLIKGFDGGIDSILAGVAIAMTASLLGLALTTWNKVVSYPECAKGVERAKNDYYDFLQKELMPSLSLGVAGSLASFKDVLGSFISKFGSNISGYAESARLLNENIQSEHLLIQDINNLNITKTSKVIAESFATLKESSESLAQFRTYQETLNSTMDKTAMVAEKFDGMIRTFEGFIDSLDKVATQAVETNALQRQFKESLEEHFPTIPDHEALWRKQIDEINEDTRKASAELQEYLRATSDYIRNFVEDNKSFISDVVDMKEAVVAVRKTAESQNAMFDAYRSSMDALKGSIDRLYDREGDNQRSVLLAVETLLEKNGNPEYTAKLQEIAEALRAIQDRSESSLDETRDSMRQIRESAENRDNELRKELAEVRSEIKSLEKNIR